MRCTTHRSAFTLVELLVSIAIALLLIIGVNSVFKITAQTVGAGNSLLTATRDARTVFQTFLSDTTNIDPVPAAGSTSGDAPFFVIRSEHVYAFRNVLDQQSASNAADPSSDTNLFPPGVYPGSQCPVTLVHFRSHRVDRLGFFSRGVFARQTTSDSSHFVSTTTGNEAYVFYAHSQQPSSASVTASGASWFDPGSGTQTSNPNNYYASDWMLSRMAMILIPTPLTTEQNYRSDSGTNGATGLAPLNVGPTAAPWSVSTSTAALTDLAATSIAKYGSVSRATTGGIQSYSWSVGSTGSAGTNYGSDWWDPVINTRYRASPFVLSGPLPVAPATLPPKITPATLAQCAPDLIRGCSQFIVEYAGNFYTKDLTLLDGTPSRTLNDGANPATPQTVPTPDATGTLDYVLVNGVRQIRWYGYPRSTTGVAGTVSASTGDVVPLRDVLDYEGQKISATGWGVRADAERFSTAPAFPTTGANYWTALSPSTDRTTHYTYTAAWGPDVKFMPFPKMIRIIIEVDDHEGRLKLPQRYEFIYDVQQ